MLFIHKRQQASRNEGILYTPRLRKIQYNPQHTYPLPIAIRDINLIPPPLILIPSEPCPLRLLQRCRQQKRTPRARSPHTHGHPIRASIHAKKTSSPPYFNHVHDIVKLPTNLEYPNSPSFLPFKNFTTHDIIFLTPAQIPTSVNLIVN
jgi:hypothetical protein